MSYTYGMRLRGFSMGCQPTKGFIKRLDSNDSRYHDMIVYDRELTKEEVERYSLDLIETDQQKKNQKLYKKYVEFRKSVDSGNVEIYDWENDDSLLEAFNQELWENAEEGDQLDIGMDIWLKLNEKFKNSDHSKPGLEIVANK